MARSNSSGHEGAGVQGRAGLLSSRRSAGGELAAQLAHPAPPGQRSTWMAALRDAPLGLRQRTRTKKRARGVTHTVRALARPKASPPWSCRG